MLKIGDKLLCKKTLIYPGLSPANNINLEKINIIKNESYTIGEINSTGVNLKIPFWFSINKQNMSLGNHTRN